MPTFGDYNRTVVGYHGTSRAAALRIVQGLADIEPTTSGEAWQGRGVYYWEHGPQQAWRWARDRATRHGKSADDVAVVASMIRLGNCFDLLDPNNGRILKNMHDRLMARLHATGEPIPRNTRGRKFLDNAVLEYAYVMLEREDGQTIDTCRAVYVPSKLDRLWKSSWLCHDTHIQLCVRNPRCILGTWLVKPAEGEEPEPQGTQ